MASRAARRNRHRGGTAVKARSVPPGTITLTGDQLAGVLAAQHRAGTLATPLPRPPQWASGPFPPGTPIPPAPVNQRRPDTGRAEPRLFELPVSTNINIATAPYVPWRILTEAADIPLFRKCIERRKGVCQLDIAVTVDPKAVAREAILAGQHEKDVEREMRKQLAPEIMRVTDWLDVPDRENGYDWPKWAGQLMENRLVYDAAVVYPRRTWGGDLLSFWVPDGSTFKPLLNEYGGRPGNGYPAYQQILYGFPRGEFTATIATGPDGKPLRNNDGTPVVPGYKADELYYERTIIRPKTPYGMSATEIALLDGILWMRRMGWMLAEYTEGVMPDAFVKVDGAMDWTVPQWEAWSQALNDRLAGVTAERLKFQLFPPGTEPVQAAGIPERYKADYDMFIVKLVAGDFGMTATEVGFPEVGSLGASFHEGEEDVLNRITRRPDANWLGGYATRLCRDQLGMPTQLLVKVLGLESEDEAAADAVAANQTSGARMTLNEDRARRGEPPYDFPEADMPMLISDRGIVFIEGSSQAAPPGTLIGPASVKPGDPGDSAGPAPDGSSGGDPDPDADDDDGDGGQGAGPRHRAPVTKTVERAALRRWLAKGRTRRPFACQVLTAADVPDLAGDPRVVLVKADAPKALAGTGPAGSGTRSW